MNVNAWLLIPFIGGTLIVIIFSDDIKENGFKEPENSPPNMTEAFPPAFMKTFYLNLNITKDITINF